jgi:hypothetical protein
MRLHMPKVHWPHLHMPHPHMTERGTRITGALIIFVLFAVMIALMVFVSTAPMYGVPLTPPVLIPAI